LAKYTIAKVGDIPPGERKIVKVAGRSIGVFNVGGEFFALRNQCPHAGGPLCEGVLSGFVRSSVPGEYDYVRRGEVIRCPWHQWEFDVRTGQSWFDPIKTRVRRYEARVEPGGSSPAAEDEMVAAGLEKGPFTAETYPVSVDERYVVIEV
jgi:nitrite reductase/ring-hydroxylating ferredoxin subunit